MLNTYQRIEQNKKISALLIVLFSLLVVGVLYLVLYIMTESSADYILPIAFGISIILTLVFYFFSGTIVLNISGAKPLDPDLYPDVYKLVENVSIASGIPIPKVYIIEDTALNAFATGKNPNEGVVCLTTGIISVLEKRELEGVIAHEMSHIQNYDSLLMTIVTVFVSSITLIADSFLRGGFRSRSDDRKSAGGSILLIIAVIALILSPIIANIVKLALSRQREYLADASAAMITRYPAGLANALRKISQDHEILEAANKATAHLYISNPFKEGFGGALANLYNTHPPIEDRILRLESM